MAGRDLKTAGDDEKFKEGRTSIFAVMKKKKKEKKKKISRGQLLKQLDTFKFFI